jgi:hypothetical protein
MMTAVASFATSYEPLYYSSAEATDIETEHQGGIMAKGKSSPKKEVKKPKKDAGKKDTKKK